MGTGPPLGVERKHLSYFWMNACMAVGLGASTRPALSVRRNSQLPPLSARCEDATRSRHAAKSHYIGGAVP